MKLTDKIVVITGAAGAYGRAVSALFAAEGASIAALDSYVSAPEECAALMQQALAQYGRIDILINCTPESGALIPAAKTEDDLYQATVMACQTGVFYACREAFRIFKQQGHGVCVNVGSTLGLGGAGGAAYEMAQHGLVGLTRNIALQYAGDPGIRINVVCSGPLEEPVSAGDDDYFMLTQRKNKSFVPPVAAEDTAKAVLFLASDDASRISGQFLQVDSGKYFKEA